MQIKFKVKMAGVEEFEVVAGPREIVAFERQFNMAFRNIDHGEHMWHLAWSAMCKAGKFAGTFDEFLDVLEESNEVEDEKTEDPTPPEVTPDPSPPSVSEAD